MMNCFRVSVALLIALALLGPGRTVAAQPDPVLRAKVVFYTDLREKRFAAAVAAGAVYRERVPHDDRFALDYAYAQRSARQTAAARSLLHALARSPYPEIRAESQQQFAGLELPTAPPPPFTDAYALLALGNLDAAREAFVSALAAHPDDAAAWHQLAYINFVLKDHTDMIVELDRYLALRPDDERAKRERADALAALPAPTPSSDAVVAAVPADLPAAAAASGATALAGELDLSGDFSNFTSPGNFYGPWQSLTGTYRWVSGRDTPSVTLITRADDDRPVATNSNDVTLDDYHTWNTRFFTYAAGSLSSGDVLPTRSIYVEGDGKFGRSLNAVFGAGVGVVVNPNGVDQRYIDLGPSIYFPGFNMSFRYLQSFTTGRTGTGTGIATFQAGVTGKTISTLTLLAGDQPPNGLVSSSQTVAFGQRALFGGIGVKHWTQPNGGILLGLQLERLTDRLSGNPIYLQHGITVGIFRSIGSGLP